MKKLLTLFAIILSMGLANAQTKEETIAWLKDKLSKYIMGRDYDPERFTDIALMSIDENKIVFVYKFKMDKQLVLLAYSVSDDEIMTLYLLKLGSHENFYRDLKR